ncbi:MAG: alpha/beta hydrolase [Pseudomonadota bacterium]
MSTKHLLDKEIAPAIEAFPRLNISLETLEAMRADRSMTPEPADAAAAGVRRKEIHAPGLKAGQPPVRCLAYLPETASQPIGGLLHLHGGGYIWGSPEAADPRSVQTAAALGVAVLSVDYRLAPEQPVPAALDDSYAALAWFHRNAEELGVDPSRIAVGGESAGGGLAAALAQQACAIGEFPICFQALTYPMLDDRTGGPEAPADPLTGEFIWTRDNNRFGWSSYLGETSPQAPCVPARAASLAGLPPAWISTAALDLFRDENIDYAQRLMRAGVPAELTVYPGACHGFQMATEAQLTKRYFRDYLDALSRAVGSAGRSHASESDG